MDEAEPGIGEGIGGAAEPTIVLPAEPPASPVVQPLVPRRPSARLVVSNQVGLTVGDGFKFGCGLMLAVGIGLLIGFVAITLGFLIASLMGVPMHIGGG